MNYNSIRTSTGKVFDVTRPAYSGEIVIKEGNVFRVMTLFLTGKAKTRKNEATQLEVIVAGRKQFISESKLHQ
jgi:hypothetical protein